MGSVGDDSEVVDERFWNKEEDENFDGVDEKNESGFLVKDRDLSNREFRVKDDVVVMIDELVDGNFDELDENKDMDIGKDGFDDNENTEEMNIDNKEVFIDRIGLDFDELN